VDESWRERGSMRNLHRGDLLPGQGVALGGHLLLQGVGCVILPAFRFVTSCQFFLTSLCT
jgi:hypothetical protein